MVSKIADEAAEIEGEERLRSREKVRERGERKGFGNFSIFP